MIDINYIKNLNTQFFNKEKVKQKHVMVIDDNRDTLDILKLILGKHEFKVTVASSITEFYTLNKTDLPDIFIIDINLTDGDGRDLCVHLKEEEATRHIPILLYTGNDLQELSSYNKMCIPDAILSKPFTVKDLNDTIVDLLSTTVVA